MGFDDLSCQISHSFLDPAPTAEGTLTFEVILFLLSLTEKDSKEDLKCCYGSCGQRIELGAKIMLYLLYS